MVDAGGDTLVRRSAVHGGRERFAYQPALDGVRAISVVLVLVFHAGFDWLGAGYLGVSVFFTLSGFLITSMLLDEFRRTGSIDIGGFFSRRVKRLLPASMLVLVVVAYARSAGRFDGANGLRNELVGAALHVYNWVRIAGDDSYIATFEGAPSLASPLEHYWSLAIEEQFYLVFPFLMVALLRVATKRHGGAESPALLSTVRRGLIAATVASAVAAPVIAASFGSDVAYWSTPTRLPELLVGAALAAVLLGRSTPSWVGHLALPALAAIVACAALVPTSTGPAYSGWLAPFALVSAALILGLQADSRLRRLVSMAPVVGLGRISYGVYLIHWPVFVFLRQEGIDLTSVGGFTLATMITIILASASATFIEQPIRSMRTLPVRAIPAAVSSMLVVAVIVAVLPFSRGFLEADREALAAASGTDVADVELVAGSRDGDAGSGSTPADLGRVDSENGRTDAAEADDSEGPQIDGVDDSGSSSDGITDTAAPPAPGRDGAAAADAPPAAVPDPVVLDVELPAPANRPVKIMTVGDSTAFYIGQAIAQWSLEHSAHARSDLLWCQGCGFILDGTITSWDAQVYVEESARVVRDRLPAKIAEVEPDVVVLMVTINDLTNRRWNEIEGVLTPADPLYTERMTEAYRAVTQQLIDAAVPSVVWVRPPVPIWAGEADEMREIERWDVMNEVIEQVASDAGPSVEVVDLDAWMNAAGHADEVGWRPDGTHLTEMSAFEVVERWLGPTLVSRALDVPAVAVATSVVPT